MATRYWSYAGPHGDGGPVSTDELAILLRERMLTAQTSVRPVDRMDWAPLSQWLPELVPFAVAPVAPPPPPAPASQPPPPPIAERPLAEKPPLEAPIRETPVEAPRWQTEPLFPQAPEPPPPADGDLSLDVPPPLPAKGTWTDRSPHPWRRYLARMFDALVIGSLSWFAFGAVFFFVAPFQAERFFALFNGPVGNLVDTMLTLLAVIPGNALMIGLTGVSIGKWLFGIKVVRPSGRPIGFFAAFGREIQVWFRGFGMGIPILSLFTLGGSFSDLNANRRTPWDPPAKRVVLHRPMNALQVFLIVVALILLVAGRVGLLWLSKTT